MKILPSGNNCFKYGKSLGFYQTFLFSLFCY